MTVIAPNDTTVGAGWSDQGKPEGELSARYSIDRITSFTSGWTGFGKIIGHTRDVDQTTVNGTLAVREGQEITIDVSFQSGPDETGQFPNALVVAGLPWTVHIPTRANVTLLGDSGSVIIDVHGGFQALQGQTATVVATLTRIGSPTTVTVGGAYLPQGVTMTDASVALGNGEQRDVSLEFIVAQDAPAVRGFGSALSVSWAAGSRTFDLAIGIYEPILYTKFNLNADWVRGDMEVTIKSDGSWTWHVTLTEHAALVGDNYVVEFGLAVPGDAASGNLGLYRIEPGVIAATLIPGDSTKFIDQGGNHPDILEHFPELVDAGVYAELDTSSNVFPLIATVAAMFTASVGLISAIKDLFADPATAATPVTP